MNPSTTALTLNMQLPNIAAVAWAVQGDQLSRFVECTLVDGSTAWNPQTGYHGVIRAHKPDGTACVYDVDEDGNPAVTWTGNVATVTIAQQAVTVAGTVLMQLEFYDSNNARITAFAWAMNVQPSAVTDTEFLSTDYYNILTLQIAAVLGSSGHAPYIDPTTKNWMIWDESLGDYADSGFSSIGSQGPAGPQGVSIISTSKASGTGAPGTTDVYNVNLSNGSVAGQFNVYNGSDGAGSPGSQLPLMDGVASVGTAITYSREDHVHPQDSEIAEIKTSLSSVKSDIGIVEDTDTATHTISKGQFVIWKNELYRATSAIPIGNTLSSSNLTAVSNGGLNYALAINDASVVVSSNAVVVFTPTSGSSHSGYGGCYYYKIGTTVHLHIGVSGITANANNSIYTMPEGFRPRTSTIAAGTGGSTYTAHAHAIVSANGGVIVASTDTFAMVDVIYDVF